MNENQFTSMMPYISADLIAMIVKKQGISEQKAIDGLYASKLYSFLEDEKTKFWQYSTPMLYSLLEQEQKTGNFPFPSI